MLLSRATTFLCPDRPLFNVGMGCPWGRLDAAGLPPSHCIYPCTQALARDLRSLVGQCQANTDQRGQMDRYLLISQLSRKAAERSIVGCVFLISCGQ